MPTTLIYPLRCALLKKGGDSIQSLAEDKEAGGEKRVSEGLDWTVYRVPMIPGGSDEESWKKDREEGGVYVGPIGAPGWTVSIRRARLARWLVDCVEDVDGMGRRLVSKVVAVGGTKA